MGSPETSKWGTPIPPHIPKQDADAIVASALKRYAALVGALAALIGFGWKGITFVGETYGWFSKAEEVHIIVDELAEKEREREILFGEAYERERAKYKAFKELNPD